MTTKANSHLAELTVNQVIVQYPATVTVFTRYGIDACCGGGIPVGVVAHRHNIDLNALLADLEWARA